MDPLIIKNESSTSVTILGIVIAPGQVYSVKSQDLLNWCKNAQLRILCRGRACSLLVYGTPLVDNEATSWLKHVSDGNIVYG